MALNPIVFTEKVVRSFLRYQLTAYPFSDPRLHEQIKKLLSLEEVRRTAERERAFGGLARHRRSDQPAAAGRS